MAYDPRDYWAKRFHAQGPTYVASSRDGSAAQAEAFTAALEPALASALRDGYRSILDYGCGTGRLAPFLSNAMEYAGVDLNAPAVEYARRTQPDHTFSVVDAEGRIPWIDQSFDVVVAVTVLQHVPEVCIAATCAEIRRVLYSGRVVLIEDANPEGRRPAAHMAFRSPERYAELLGLPILSPATTFNAERPGSHWIAEFGE